MIALSKKYVPLVESESRYFILTGGRGSGKSFSVNTILCLMLMEPMQKILFLRQTLTSAYLSIIPEFLEKIELLHQEASFDVTKTEIVNKSNDNSILFRGIQTGSKNNTANLKSLQGISTLVIDEAEELVDEKIFDKINLSIRQKGVQNRVILILNPSTKEHWIYKRFFEQAGVQPGYNGIKGNVTYIHTSYLDNIKNLDQSFVDEAELLRDTNPTKYEHQILGGWLNKAEGVIFTNWELGDFKEVGPVVYGQDYGWSIDPTTLVKTSIDSKRKLIYLKELLYKPKLDTSQIFEYNKDLAGIGSLIYADSDEHRLIAELKQRGLKNIKECPKPPGSILAGIGYLQDYKLIVDGVNLTKELNNYVWHDRKSSTPIDDYNHLIDACRYAIYPQLSKNKLKPTKLHF
jgi:phage terminase large subunit